MSCPRAIYQACGYRGHSKLWAWLGPQASGIEASFEQVRRVLKRCGILRFRQQCLVPEAQIAARRRRWTPYSVKFAGGGPLDRYMEALIRGAGLDFDRPEKSRIKWLPKPLRFSISVPRGQFESLDMDVLTRGNRVRHVEHL